MHFKKHAHKFIAVLLGACLGLLALVYDAPEARACGCLAPPDPTVPVVQNAERIAFAMQDGEVVAHIQIQYEGNAEEFAWLVPVPAIPDMEVGTDELFAQLIAQTQPLYALNRFYEGNCAFDPSRGGFPGGGRGDQDDGAQFPEAPTDAGPDSPLVLRDTAGPYDFAVLSAANKDAMFDWLQQESFFVPTGTEAVVDPYINPNAYFLALKLRTGASAGDLQPIVVRYQSNLPMIPIILTSVAANPDMGILVWMLGETRAIPRNYFHTVINDARIDWLNAGANYLELLTDAVDESEGHHSFVTEYAGTSSIMVDLLDYEGRFGNLAELATITDAIQYSEFLLSRGYAVVSNFNLQFPSQLVTILDGHIPAPQALIDYGVTPAEYYLNMSYYLGWFRDENPELFTDLDLDYDPVTLTDEIEERIVEPTLAAGQLFRDHPYLTRLFTTLSPNEMNRDPVFSWGDNQLPEVATRHEATITYHCGLYAENRVTTPATLVTEQGWILELPDGEDGYDWGAADMPSSAQTQVMREEGAAQNITDNDEVIGRAIDEFRPATGCSASGGSGNQLWLLLGCALLLATRRRRRQRG